MPPSSRLTLLQGDCLRHLRSLPPGAVDMVYLDPPFNTGIRRARGAMAFDDRWPDVASYLHFLEPRLEACLHALHADGTLLVHCDWRTSHRVRVLLDDLLGPNRFVNHLIWAYGLGGSSSRRFARKHDDILFYAKSERYHFAPPRVPATSVRLRDQSKKATDVLNIPSINNMARERTGYPTQKPLALLMMLVEACCPPGGTVLDPFCGSGTTLVAAVMTGRPAIGMDMSAAALRIARRRCEAALFREKPARRGNSALRRSEPL